MRKPNFLILDEPTNDLDIRSLEVLEDYLDSFKGCVIVISHDRFFMDRIVDHIFAFEGDGVIKDFPGGYSDYRLWRTEKERAEQQEKKAESGADKNASQQERKQQRAEQRKNKMTYAERREFEALTVEIDTLTAEKEQLEALFNSGTAIDDIAAKSARYDEVKSLLDDKELRWLELSEKE